MTTPTHDKNCELMTNADVDRGLVCTCTIPANDRHKDNDCDYGKVIDGFHTDDCTCPTPAKEWEYKVNDIMKRCKDGETGTHLEMEELIHSLLDQHSAHLVERISELKVKHLIDENGKEYCDLPHEYCDTCEHNKALDQAIDIVKNNK